MEFAFRTTVLALTVLSASVAFGQAPHMTLAKFLGASHSCNPGCCPSPCESKCCPAPCEPACCPAPCEPACCPPPSCGCESQCCDSCCQPSCGCCRRQYPLESLLSRMDRAICGKKHHKPCDPCGYDLWPCVGECCNSCPSPGGHVAPPSMLDPGLLQPHNEKQIDPFQDDPEQPPRPPMAPAAVRGARLQPAIQRYSR